MASVQKVSLLPSEALTASKTGDKKSLGMGDDGFVGWINISANDGSTTVDCDIEHSADGTNWEVLASFTQVVNTTAVESIQITNSVLPNVRANVTLAGTPSATVEVALYHDRRR